MIKAKLRSEGLEADIKLDQEAYPEHLVYGGDLYVYGGEEERVGIYKLLEKSVYIAPPVEEPLDWQKY